MEVIVAQTSLGPEEGSPLIQVEKDGNRDSKFLGGIFFIQSIIIGT